MHTDPQSLAREMIVTTNHPVAGRVDTLGLPVKFSATPGGIAQPAPLLGEHSREVLAELGFSAAEIASMVDRSAERRVGKECVRTFRSRWLTSHTKQTK